MKLTSTRTTVSAFFLLSIVWSLWSSSRITSTAVKSSLSLSTINTTTTTKRTAEDSKDEDYNYNYNYSNNYNTTRIKEHLLQRIDVNQAKCGCFKCFYRAKESTTNLDMDTNINNSNIVEIGWAVAEDRRFFNHKKHAVFPTLSEGMMTGWTLAQELQGKYGIRHFLLEPPMVLPKLTRSEQEYLNTNMPQENECHDHDPFTAIDELLVQKQTVAPESNFLYKCKVGKHSRLIKQLEAVMMDSKSNMVGTKTDFCQQLEKDFRVVFDMFHEIPLYHEDFQVFINAHDGSVTHLDFDRLVQWQYMTNAKRLKTGRNECRRNMQEFLARAWQLANNTQSEAEEKQHNKDSSKED